MNPTHNYRQYFVYVLRSSKNDSLYIGCTSDLQKRLEEHNNKQNTSTARYAPWEVIYFEGFISKDDAYKREQSLKLHAQGLRRLKERLRDTLKR